MSIQHNDSLSLDWLMPLFTEQMADLSAYWQRCQDGDLSAVVPDMAKDYHQIAGALTMVNLPLFAELSEALSSLTLQIVTQQGNHKNNSREGNDSSDGGTDTDMLSLVNLATRSHDLLSSELEQLLVSGNYHQQLIVANTDDIARILISDADIAVNESAGSDITNNFTKLDDSEKLSTLIELPSIATDKLNLSLEQREKIKLAWQFHQEKLFAYDNNDNESIKQIYKMSQFVWRSCADTLEQKVWYLACLWLGCLPENSVPKPQQYGRIIEKLNNILADSLQLDKSEMLSEKELSPADESVYETMIAELFIQIKLLGNVDKETGQLLSGLYINRSGDSDEFFARTLEQLEQIIFQIHEPKVIMQPLVAIKQQLDRRGWGIYVTYLELILADLESGVDSEELYAQIQWQVERQLQELYGSIFAMKQNIGDDGRESASDEAESESSSSSQSLRQVRIAVENIKTAFNQYISNHELSKLPTADDFESIRHNLVEMEIDQVTDVLDELASLFNRYHENNLKQVNWTVIGATADSIAEFELFLDYLARQILDVERLEQASKRVEQANAHIDNFLASPQSTFDEAEKPADDSVVRYADTGEIAPKPAIADSKDVIDSTAKAVDGVKEVDGAKEAEKDSNDDVTDAEISLEDEAGDSTSDNTSNNKEPSEEENSTTEEPITDETESKEDVPVSDEGVSNADEENSESVVSDALTETRAMLPVDDFDMDEDIQEIFIEEATEVLELMDENLPKWQENPEDLDVLREIRRGFHTLKGSGRMVGAHSVGEMSWAVESMLNSVLDRSLPVSDELVHFIIETKDLIPTLVDDYANKQAPTIDTAITVLKANNLLTGKAINEGVPEFAQLPSSITAPVTTGADAPVISTDTDTDSTGAEKTSLETTDIDDANQVTVTGASGDFVVPKILESYWEDVQDLPVDTDDADEDIKEIFIEEAEEVLETITPIFDQWCTETDNNDLLTDIRRGFHTLKGSGRMVGANHTAELAWSIENMLNRVLDNTIESTSGLLSLTKDVLDAYPELVQTYADGSSDYSDLIPLWVASANAYSKNLGNQFDYRKLLQAYQVTESVDSTTVDKASADKMTVDKLAPATEETSISTVATPVALEQEDTSNSMQAVKQQLAETPTDFTEEDISDEEREFIDIFMEEGKERLATIQKFIAAHKNEEKVEVTDELVRAFHTLRGASGAESLHTISNISHSIEGKLSQLQQNERAMTAQHINAMAQAASLIEAQLAAYENSLDDATIIQSEQEVQAIQSLLTENLTDDGVDNMHAMTVANLIDDKIDELLDAEWDIEEKFASADEVTDYASLMASQIAILQNRTKASQTFQSLLMSMNAVYQLVLDKPEMAENHAIQESLIAGHQQLSELFDSLASGMTLNLDEEVVARLNEIAGVESVVEAGDEADTGRETETETSMPVVDTVDDSAVNDRAVDDGVVNDRAVEDNNTGIAETIASPVKDENGITETKVEEATIEEAKPIEYEEITTDPDLLEIFLEEANELDTDIVTSFAKWRKDPTDMESLKELQRHLHTIKGGARMSGIASIGDLTHEIESIYESFVRKRMMPSGPWLSVMQTAQDVLSMQIEEVKEHQRSFLTTDMIEELQAFAKLDELPENAHLTMPILKHKVEEVEEVVVVEEEEVENLDEIAINFQKLVRDSWNGERPDPDILEVFLEEADELIESSSENLQKFRSNTGALSNLQALQRELHTIKGGARMVGANGIADLSHEMETVYEELGSRRLPATKMVLELLASCHDWLANSIYLLKNNINPPMPTVLIEALKAFHKNPDTLKEVATVSLQSYTDIIEQYEDYLRSLKGDHDTSDMPPMLGNFGVFEDTTDISGEQIRVSSGLMEQMINLSGESAINRARIDMGMSSLSNSIEEMGTTVQRLADQLRRMDIELEAQIMAQIDDEELLENEDFDPLEMDQYSALNQLSKSLSESASDLLDIKSTLLEKTRDSENLLMQLSRTQAELQEGLMSSRMVPFSRLTPRLQRIVRQTANEIGKEVELKIVNADGEMDRTILERITSPLEHMLRNAVDHGIESADERELMGKDRMGRINLSILREGSEMVVHLSDDGSGIDVEQVRKKAIAQGLIDPNDDTLTDTDIMQYIFNAGLSTTKKVTQISGRGVGMDVVRSEIRQLGGTVSVESTKGKGSRFTMRVPLTVAVSDALVVRAADKHYVIPLVQIERVEQVSPNELHDYYQSDRHTFDIQGQAYRLRYLNEILTGNAINDLASSNNTLPVIIIKNQTGQNLALQVDEIIGSRLEVVVKPLGKQLSHLAGVSAATIMGDGSVVLILDLMALVRNAPVRQITTVTHKPVVDTRKKILVIDDSVTVRKVTSRFLEREGFDAHVAKDGVDALEILQEFTPDLMLLDIEMPRMDGFEVATQVRNTARLVETPIIMITSRTGDKHRERAMEIGVNDYLGKPFQESILLEKINELIGAGKLVKNDS